MKFHLTSTHPVKCLALVVIALTPFYLHAGGGPENVLVVVNNRSWASKTIANEFIRLRHIPLRNVVYLQNIPTHETIEIDEFRSIILQPVLKHISDQKLGQQIDYIAYSSDLPYSVNLRSDIAKLENKPSKIFTPVGSINGLTYLTGLVMAKNPAYIQLNTNFYTRRMIRSNAKVQLPANHKPFSDEEKKAFAEALKLTQDKKFNAASKLYAQLLKTRSQNALIHYNLACCYAQMGKTKLAIQSLSTSSQLGWTNYTHAIRDEDLASLRENKDFQLWITKLKETQFTIQPTLGFRNLYQWSPRGERIVSGGSRYYLSTMLAMTSGRGNSVTEAISCLQRGKLADASHPEGKIYILKNKNVRSTTRERAFEPVVKELKSMGISAEIQSGVLPKNKKDVMGVVIGSARYEWETSGSKILPGAIVESLTSTSGVMRERASQTPLSNLIRNGATGSSGTVTEPYALQAKFPSPFIHVHYASGCSLAEAFYQSVAGPYQLLIVGDPLCQPWAKFPVVTVQELYPGIKLRKDTTLTPLYKGSLSEIDHFELFINGRRVSLAGPREKLLLDTKNLLSGFYELSVVAVAAGTIETQGECRIPIELIKENSPVLLTIDNNYKAHWSDTLNVHVECEDAQEILLLHNSKILARSQSNKDDFQIDPMVLGDRRVSLFAIGMIDGKPTFSHPVTLEILPDKAIQPVEKTMPTTAVDGLLLSQTGKSSVVISDTHSAGWLEKQKLSSLSEFELTGIFEVSQNEVYQFQINNNCNAQIFVDNIELKQRFATGWNYLPVNLKKGVHQFRLKGRTPLKNPRIRICFGGRGTFSLTGKKFKHLPDVE